MAWTLSVVTVNGVGVSALVRDAPVQEDPGMLQVMGEACQRRSAGCSMHPCPRQRILSPRY